MRIRAELSTGLLVWSDVNIILRKLNDQFVRSLRCMHATLQMLSLCKFTSKSGLRKNLKMSLINHIVRRSLGAACGWVRWCRPPSGCCGGGVLGEPQCLLVRCQGGGNGWQPTPRPTLPHRGRGTATDSTDACSRRQQGLPTNI